jgi:hypothetical protein
MYVKLYTTSAPIVRSVNEFKLFSGRCDSGNKKGKRYDGAKVGLAESGDKRSV